MNWKLKVLTQFVLAHIPFGEAFNHRLQHWRAARDGGYEARIRRRIHEGIGGLALIRAAKPIDGATVVEVGTGWDALPTLMLHSAGAGCIHTFDHVAHLRIRMARLAAKVLAEEALTVSEHVGCDRSLVESRIQELRDSEHSLQEFLRRAGFNYVAPGDAANTGLPSQSVDIYYSFAVLEHVPESAVNRIVVEAKRVLKNDGVFYALVGLHDHYNFDPSVSDVNFLKYPEWLWALLVKNKISYHNRMRERDFLEILKQHGAEIVTVNSTVHDDDVERVRLMRVDERFKNYTPLELATTRTEIIARFSSSIR